MDQNEKTIEKIVGERLTATMKSQRLTRSALGDRVGITRQAIGQYMDGKSMPTADKLAKIAKELGVSSDYLLGLSDQPRVDIDALEKDIGLTENTLERLRTLRDKALSASEKGFIKYSVEQYFINLLICAIVDSRATYEQGKTMLDSCFDYVCLWSMKTTPDKWDDYLQETKEDLFSEIEFECETTICFRSLMESELQSIMGAELRGDVINKMQECWYQEKSDRVINEMQVLKEILNHGSLKKNDAALHRRSMQINSLLSELEMITNNIAAFGDEVNHFSEEIEDTIGDGENNGEC